jgi:glucose-6-phosphate isomerase
MVHPLRMDWELTGNVKSLESVIKAAYNLSSRFNEKTGAIRSWNLAESKTYNISDARDNFLVIIDSMANMDLLFYVGSYTGDQELIRKASSHAQTVTRTLLRPDFSTYHVVNMNPEDGEIKHHFTHQGYNDSSCWSRYEVKTLIASYSR